MKSFWQVFSVVVLLMLVGLFLKITRNNTLNPSPPQQINGSAEISPADTTIKKTVENTTALARHIGSGALFAQKKYKEVVESLIPRQNALTDEEQWNLGYCYLYGFGIQKNFEEAKKWIEKSASAGNARATALMGYIYERGYGVTQDFKMALDYYLESASHNDPMALTNLGYMYEMGSGTSRDMARAIEFYQEAADQGWALAENNLGWLNVTGKVPNASFEKGVSLLESAAMKDDINAGINLKRIYSNGLYTKPDEVVHNQWSSLVDSLLVVQYSHRG